MSLYFKDFNAALRINPGNAAAHGNNGAIYHTQVSKLCLTER